MVVIFIIDPLMYYVNKHQEDAHLVIDENN